MIQHLDENNVTKRLVLEEEMGQTLPDFVQLRIPGTCLIFGMIMAFCFHVFAIGICRRN